MVFWKQFSMFTLDDLFFAVRTSFEQKSSSKSKIELRNETLAEDKFQNVKETKL